MVAEITSGGAVQYELQPVRVAASAGAPAAWAARHLAWASLPIDGAGGDGGVIAPGSSHSDGPWPVALIIASGPAMRSRPINLYYGVIPYDPGPLEYDGMALEGVAVGGDGAGQAATSGAGRHRSRRRAQGTTARKLLSPTNTSAPLGPTTSGSQTPSVQPPPAASGAAKAPATEGGAVAPPSPPLPPSPPQLPPDAYLISDQELGDAVRSGLALDITSLVRADRAVQWSGLLPPYQYGLYRHGGRSYALPLRMSAQLLYYDRKLLQERGIAPPRTWRQLLTAVARLHGQDLNGDQQPDYGLCLVSHALPPVSSQQPNSTGASPDAAAACGASSQPDPLPLLLDIFASLVQTRGPRQGVWFSQDGSLEPWVGGPDMQEALKLTAALLAVSPLTTTLKEATAAAPTGCDTSGPGPGGVGAASQRQLQLFLAGRCAFAIAQGLSPLKALAAAGSAAPPPRLRGRLGASPLPGSDVTWHVSNSSLTPCDADVCPFAELVESKGNCSSVAASGVPYAEDGTGSDRVAAGQGQGAACASPAQSQARVMVNRAQFVWTRAAAVVAAQSQSAERQLLSYALLSAPLRGDDAIRDVLDTTSDAEPFRYSHLGTDPWVAAGYHPDDTAAALAAYGAVMAQPNLALPLAVPGAGAYMAAVRSLATAYLASATAADAAAAVMAAANGTGAASASLAAAVDDAAAAALTRSAADAVRAALAPDQETAAAVTVWYMRSLRSWTRLPGPPAAAMAPGAPLQGEPAPPANAFALPGWAIVGIVLVGGFLLAILATLLWELLLRFARSGWDARVAWLGAVQPPPASPDLTLLLSDVQGSTSLWEDLPAVVMDASMRMHAEAFRLLLLQHRGYESATEGDAFICAFSTPAAALAFSVQLQAALLELPWPRQLLREPQAAELYMRPRGPHGGWADTALAPPPRRPTPLPVPGGPGPDSARASTPQDAGPAAPGAAGRESLRGHGSEHLSLQGSDRRSCQGPTPALLARSSAGGKGGEQGEAMPLQQCRDRHVNHKQQHGQQELHPQGQQQSGPEAAGSGVRRYPSWLTVLVGARRPSRKSQEQALRSAAPNTGAAHLLDPAQGPAMTATMVPAAAAVAVVGTQRGPAGPQGAHAHMHSGIHTTPQFAAAGSGKVQARGAATPAPGCGVPRLGDRGVVLPPRGVVLPAPSALLPPVNLPSLRGGSDDGCNASAARERASGRRAYGAVSSPEPSGDSGGGGGALLLASPFQQGVASGVWAAERTTDGTEDCTAGTSTAASRMLLELSSTLRGRTLAGASSSLDGASVSDHPGFGAASDGAECKSRPQSPVTNVTALAMPVTALGMGGYSLYTPSPEEAANAPPEAAPRANLSPFQPLALSPLRTSAGQLCNENRGCSGAGGDGGDESAGGDGAAAMEGTRSTSGGSGLLARAFARRSASTHERSTCRLSTVQSLDSCGEDRAMRANDGVVNAGGGCARSTAGSAFALYGAGGAHADLVRGPEDFRQHMLSLFEPCDADAFGAVCVYRGLRIRLGLHCGGVEARSRAVELRPNKASGRTIYGGPLMAAARAVSNTVTGGAIVISEQARLRLQAMGHLHHTDAGIALYMGHYELPQDKSDRPPPSFLPPPPLAAQFLLSSPVAGSAKPTPLASCGNYGTAADSAVPAVSLRTDDAGGDGRTCSGQPALPSHSVSQSHSTSHSQLHLDSTFQEAAAAAAAAAAADRSVALYQLVGGPRALMSARAAFEPPLSRAGACVAVGTLSAPLGGAVAICELRAVGSTVLAAWNSKVFGASMGMMAACCRRLAARHAVSLVHEGGPKAQRSSGLVAVGVCADAAALIAWGLECQLAGLELPWPAELLEHELGEAACARTGSGASSSAWDSSPGRRHASARAGSNSSNASSALAALAQLVTTSASRIGHSRLGHSFAIGGSSAGGGSGSAGRGSGSAGRGSGSGSGANGRTGSYSRRAGGALALAGASSTPGGRGAAAYGIGRRAVAVQGAGACRWNSLRTAREKAWVPAAASAGRPASGIGNAAGYPGGTFLQAPGIAAPCIGGTILESGGDSPMRTRSDSPTDVSWEASGAEPADGALMTHGSLPCAPIIAAAAAAAAATVPASSVPQHGATAATGQVADAWGSPFTTACHLPGADAAQQQCEYRAAKGSAPHGCTGMLPPVPDEQGLVALAQVRSHSPGERADTPVLSGLDAEPVDAFSNRASHGDGGGRVDGNQDHAVNQGDALAGAADVCANRATTDVISLGASDIVLALPGSRPSTLTGTEGGASASGGALPPALLSSSASEHEPDSRLQRTSAREQQPGFGSVMLLRTTTGSNGPGPCVRGDAAETVAAGGTPASCQRALPPALLLLPPPLLLDTGTSRRECSPRAESSPPMPHGPGRLPHQWAQGGALDVHSAEQPKQRDSHCQVRPNSSDLQRQSSMAEHGIGSTMFADVSTLPACGLRRAARLSNEADLSPLNYADAPADAQQRRQGGEARSQLGAIGPRDGVPAAARRIRRRSWDAPTSAADTTLAATAAALPDASNAGNSVGPTAGTAVRARSGAGRYRNLARRSSALVLPRGTPGVARSCVVGHRSCGSGSSAGVCGRRRSLGAAGYVDSRLSAQGRRRQAPSEHCRSTREGGGRSSSMAQCEAEAGVEGMGVARSASSRLLDSGSQGEAATVCRPATAQTAGASSWTLLGRSEPLAPDSDCVSVGTIVPALPLSRQSVRSQRASGSGTVTDGSAANEGVPRGGDDRGGSGGSGGGGAARLLRLPPGGRGLRMSLVRRSREIAYPLRPPSGARGSNASGHGDGVAPGRAAQALVFRRKESVEGPALNPSARSNSSLGNGTASPLHRALLQQQQIVQLQQQQQYCGSQVPVVASPTGGPHPTAAAASAAGDGGSGTGAGCDGGGSCASGRGGGGGGKRSAPWHAMEAALARPIAACPKIAAVETAAPIAIPHGRAVGNATAAAAASETARPGHKAEAPCMLTDRRPAPLALLPLPSTPSLQHGDEHEPQGQPGSGAAGAVAGRLVYRGLRLKGAVDVGRVQASLVGTSGRLLYRGRAADKAAALAALAWSGQLLVTKAAVRAVCKLDRSTRLDAVPSPHNPRRAHAAYGPPNTLHGAAADAGASGGSTPGSLPAGHSAGGTSDDEGCGGDHAGRYESSAAEGGSPTSGSRFSRPSFFRNWLPRRVSPNQGPLSHGVPRLDRQPAPALHEDDGDLELPCRSRELTMAQLLAEPGGAPVVPRLGRAGGLGSGPGMAAPCRTLAGLSQSAGGGVDGGPRVQGEAEESGLTCHADGLREAQGCRTESPERSGRLGSNAVGGSPTAGRSDRLPSRLLSEPGARDTNAPGLWRLHSTGPRFGGGGGVASDAMGSGHGRAAAATADGAAHPKPHRSGLAGLFSRISAGSGEVYSQRETPVAAASAAAVAAAGADRNAGRDAAEVDEFDRLVLRVRPSAEAGLGGHTGERASSAQGVGGAGGGPSVSVVLFERPPRAQLDRDARALRSVFVARLAC